MPIKWQNHIYISVVHHSSCVLLSFRNAVDIEPITDTNLIVSSQYWRGVVCLISWLAGCAGARGRPGQYLRGQLAGLVLTTNTTDSDDAIDCLNRCQEKLELSGTDFVDNGMVSEPMMPATDLPKTSTSSRGITVENATVIIVPHRIIWSCAHATVHHYNGTQYCTRETVLLTFPFLQTNITSQMCQVEVRGEMLKKYCHKTAKQRTIAPQ